VDVCQDNTALSGLQEVKSSLGHPSKQDNTTLSGLQEAKSSLGTQISESGV
jgi:hypothetical protein